MEIQRQVQQEDFSYFPIQSVYNFPIQSVYKSMTPGRSYIWPQGHNLNNLGKEATNEYLYKTIVKKTKLFVT